MEDSEMDTIYNLPRISPCESTSGHESEDSSRLQEVKVI